MARTDTESARVNQQGQQGQQGQRQGEPQQGQRGRGAGGMEHAMEQMDFRHVADSALSSFREYAKAQPETVALWCLGIGFVLGWKLKPW